MIGLAYFILTVLLFNIGAGLNLSPVQLENAIKKSADLLETNRVKEKVPGIVVGVGINGTAVWTQAFGQTDIENNVITRVDSVWRLASISKSLTSALIGHLIDRGLIDLDKSIHEYIKHEVFPIKTWNGKNVTLTVGQVMSHTAGLRPMKSPEDLYHRLTFNNVTETLSALKDEPLVFEPGTNFNYSNFGYQIIGAIIESVLNQTYESAINQMFKELQMNSTFCERREQLVQHRARFYMRTLPISELKIVNTELADDLVSIEAYWPAGGVISTVPDLLKFGSNMIRWSKGLNATKNFNLNPKTVSKLWSPVYDLTEKVHTTDKYKYGHGWFITEFESPINCTTCQTSKISRVVWHTGTMSGLKTVLLIEPINDMVITLFFNCPPFDDLGTALRILRNFLE